MTRPLIVDIHTHAFADEIADRAVGTLAKASGIQPFSDGTLAGLRSEQRRAGVDVCVVQPVATKTSHVPVINDWAAREQTDALRFFGAMHPDFEDPFAEVERIAALGLCGIKLHTQYQEFHPDEPRMAPIYEACIEHGLVILFHAGEDEFLPTLIGDCKPFVRMLERWPKLTAVLAHMGGYRQWESVTCDLLGRDVYLDTSYSLGHMPDDEFLDMVERHGADKVIFGSDSPWDDMAVQVQRVRDLPLPQEQRDAIIGGNAASLLRL